jgi:hypothetical protein
MYEYTLVFQGKGILCFSDQNFVWISHISHAYFKTCPFNLLAFFIPTIFGRYYENSNYATFSRLIGKVLQNIVSTFCRRDAIKYKNTILSYWRLLFAVMETCSK